VIFEGRHSLVRSYLRSGLIAYPVLSITLDFMNHLHLFV
jgi:hypothetical protein